MHGLLISVARETEVADLSFFFHPEQELRKPCAVIEILIDIQLADVMVEIKVEIVSFAFLKLFFENLLVLAEVRQIVAWELACKIITASVVFRQSFSDNCLAVACVIAPCGIVLIDTVRHRVIYHLLHSLRIRS